MTLLHPEALLALLLLVPLAIVERRRLRRERGAARAVGLQPERLSRGLRHGACAALVVALVAVAASEPSLRRALTVKLRADAEAYLFLDASGSMLAGASSSAPTRLEQARKAAADFARALPADLPLGAGALPETPLPLTAPNADRQQLLAALDRLAVPGTLPEHLFVGGIATDFGSLRALTRSTFFLPKTRHRIVVVLTDDEGPAFDEVATAASLKRAHIHLVLVRFGTPRDRLWLHRPGRAPILDTDYRPDLADLGEMRLLARQTGGGFYEQGRLGDAIGEVDRLAGHGPDRPAETLSLYADPLGQFFALAALPALAWLAGALLPFSEPLGWRPRLPRRSSSAGEVQRERAALENQA